MTLSILIHLILIGADSQHWYIDGFVWRGERPRALPEYTEFNVRSVHLLFTKRSKIFNCIRCIRHELFQQNEANANFLNY